MSSTRRRAFAVIAAGALAVSVAYAVPAYAAPPSNNNSVKKITKAVTLDGVLEHLEALQGIADANGGNRAAGLPGYEASVNYVMDQLTAAGYQPVKQAFQFEYFEENSELIRVSPQPTTFEEGTDFLRNTFDSGTPEGTATGPLVLVDFTNPPVPHGRQQRLRRGRLDRFPGRWHRAGATRHMRVRRQGPQRAGRGAAAVIIANDGRAGRAREHDRRRYGTHHPRGLDDHCCEPRPREHARSHRHGEGGLRGRRAHRLERDRRDRDRERRERRHGRARTSTACRRAPASTTTGREALRCSRPRSRCRR